MHTGSSTGATLNSHKNMKFRESYTSLYACTNVQNIKYAVRTGVYLEIENNKM